jgi:hypothetical protein
MKQECFSLKCPSSSIDVSMVAYRAVPPACGHFLLRERCLAPVFGHRLSLTVCPSFERTGSYLAIRRGARTWVFATPLCVRLS